MDYLQAAKEIVSSEEDEECIRNFGEDIFWETTYWKVGKEMGE
jgi:hypothetical protein